jgi:Alpha/beta hydrolase of unknown function (DUF900)
MCTDCDHSSDRYGCNATAPTFLFASPYSAAGIQSIKFLFLLFVFLLNSFFVVKATSAEDFCDRCEIYEVSTRHLGCCLMPLAENRHSLEVCKLESNGQWVASNVETIANDRGADKDRVTIFYIHGNWMTRENARSRVEFLCRLIQCQTTIPFRVVMLSWPSQRERHPVQDIKENADCTNVQAFHLAWLLSRMPADEPISIMGFSFGGRVVTGAMHLIAGGKISSLGLNDFAGEEIYSPDQLRKYRVSLAAPALDRSWLSPGKQHGQAMESIDRLVNLYNSKDPVLRRFRFVDFARPTAAGFTGFQNTGDPRQTMPLASQDRVAQFDCGSQLGSTHDEKSYYTKCPCFKRAVKNLFSEE